MRPSTSGLARLIRGAMALLMIGLILGAPLRAARAGGVSITTFYTTTLQAFNAWKPSTSGAPARTSVFPAGTGYVAYYFEFRGAVPAATRIQVILRAPDGVTKGAVHVLHHTDGSFGDDFYDQPAFVPGKHTYDLLVNGVKMASTTFTIKSGFAVPAFYATTKKAMDAWLSSATAPAPPVTRTFPAGTAEIGYYFGFSGAKPAVSTFYIVMYHNGSAYLSGNKHTLHHVAGYFGGSFQNQPSFPAGSYRYDIIFAGQPVKSASFTVSG